jgi:hypothetical protein
LGLATYFEPEPNKGSAMPWHRTQPWYKAYMEALFEYDPARAAGQFRYAEELIGKRQRELLAGPSTAAERRAMKEAVRALQSVQMCLQH